MPDDNPFSSLAEALSPQELQRIHTATYLIKTGKIPGEFDQDKVNQSWSALQPVIERGGGAARGTAAAQAGTQPVTAMPDTRTGFEKLTTPSQGMVGHVLSAFTMGKVTDPSQIEEYLNNPAIPKTRGEAFISGAAKDLAGVMGGQFLTPLGAATTIGSAGASIAARSGITALTEAQVLAQSARAAAAAGDVAKATELAGQARTALSSANTVAKVGQTAKTVAGVGQTGFAAGGVDRALDPNASPNERILGGINAALGVVGAARDFTGASTLKSAMAGAVPETSVQYNAPDVMGAPPEAPATQPRGSVAVTKPTSSDPVNPVPVRPISPNSIDSLDTVRDTPNAPAVSSTVQHPQQAPETSTTLRESPIAATAQPGQMAAALNPKLLPDVAGSVSRPDSVRPPATQTKSAIEAPKTASEIIPTIGSKAEGLVRPNALEDADLKTIAQMPQATAISQGLSRDDHMAAVAEAKRRFGADAVPSQRPVEDIHTAITRITKASDPEDLARRQSEFRDHLSTLMKAPVDDQVGAVKALVQRAQLADEYSANIQRVVNAKDFAAEVRALRSQNKLDNPGLSSEVNDEGVVKTSKNLRSYQPSTESQYADLVVGRGLGKLVPIRDPDGKIQKLPAVSPEQAQERDQFVKDTTNQLSKHLSEVRAQGGVPTQEQRAHGVGLIDSLQAGTGMRYQFKGASSDVDPNQATWNTWMGRSPKSHFAKPSEAQITRRLPEHTW